MARLTGVRMWSKLFVLANVLLVSGCNVINSIGPNCDRSAASNEPIKYTEGTIDNGVYMSSPWAGELLYFPGGTRYELRFDRGVPGEGFKETPHFVQAWLSFDHCGTKNSTVAMAAGNQAEVREIDQDKLVIVNGSCSDYWLLVVAGTGTEALAPPGTGAEPSESDGVCELDGGADDGG
jgi:hypothetical protein